MSLRRVLGLALLIAGFIGLFHAVYQVSTTTDLAHSSTLSYTIGEFVAVVLAFLAGGWLFTNQGLKRPDTHGPKILVCTECGRMAQPHAKKCAYCGGLLKTG